MGDSVYAEFKFTWSYAEVADLPAKTKVFNSLYQFRQTSLITHQKKTKNAWKLKP